MRDVLMFFFIFLCVFRKNQLKPISTTNFFTRVVPEGPNLSTLQVSLVSRTFVAPTSKHSSAPTGLASFGFFWEVREMTSGFGGKGRGTSQTPIQD